MDWLGWLTGLLRKLPTVKGFSNYLYVAANWTTISNVFEECNRQTTVYKQWLKDQEETLKKIHELEKQAIIKEYEQKFRNAGDAVSRLGESYGEALGRLALFYHLNTLEWELDRHRLTPSLRQSIEGIMARLAPPPPLCA